MSYVFSALILFSSIEIFLLKFFNNIVLGLCWYHKLLKRYFQVLLLRRRSRPVHLPGGRLHAQLRWPAARPISKVKGSKSSEKNKQRQKPKGQSRERTNQQHKGEQTCTQICSRSPKCSKGTLNTYRTTSWANNNTNIGKLDKSKRQRLEHHAPAHTRCMFFKTSRSEKDTRQVLANDAKGSPRPC